ncbi:putative transcription factor/ chromatin remodeling BED-type(Zn) family [Helianthus debilis subsp. tardiflorus]
MAIIMDSQEEEEINPQSESTAHSNVRAKTDITWKYVTEAQDENGKKMRICTFCNKSFRGGGINRMKQHLGGVKGNVAACLKVPADVRCQMKILFEESTQKGKNTVVLETETGSTLKSKSLGKRKASSTSDNAQSYFSRGINDHTQPSIRSVWQSKERVHDTDLAVAMWLYDACIPMNAVNSPLFPIAMSKVASMGHGYTGPSYHQVRVNLLKDAKQSVKLIVDSYREQWAERGCTIMSDGWRDVRQRALINFLVYCPTGISFIKSVDASDIESNAEGLCNLFSEIVEIVGSKNIVHLVTDNAANYKAAGRLLCDRYPMISWSPCAAHYINLILKDVSEMEDVSTLIQLASRITVFIYNHKWPLNWLRKRPGWTEIIRPGATRFGTSFIALKSLHDHKHDLQALVTSLDFKKMLKVTKANDVKDTILDPKFWNNCFITVQVMTPILRLLRICDYDEKPSLGYVYEGMLRIRKGIKELFKRKRRNYKRYVDIIDARWDKMLRKSLHAAAYWLNPIFQYEKDNREEKDKAWVGVLDMIEKLTSLDNSVQITISHLAKFRDKVGTFGRSIALNSVELERPG